MKEGPAYHPRTFTSVLVGMTILAGCGGSSPGQKNEGERSITLGQIVTRVVGLLPALTSLGGSGAVVTAVGGANIQSVTLRDIAPTLNETNIAFTSTLHSLFFEIYMMNANGSTPIRLTNNLGIIDEYPAWSPDGSKIAFARSQGGNYDIYVMNTDGSSQIRLTSHSATDYQPAWSPDGSKIVFSSNRDGNYEIYVMNADGSTQTRLTTSTGIDYLPDWSPSGDKIAFTSDRDGNNEIYVMNADGSGQVRLTNNTAVDQYPAWSPDGSRIAFSSSRDGNEEIYVMGYDGSAPTRLTNTIVTDKDPAWSPDGNKIAFISNNELYVMNADGSAQTRLTNNQAFEEHPSWSPFVRMRTLVGIGGAFGTGAAGFLFGQSGDDITSFVAFDTYPYSRSQASITSQALTHPDQPNLIFVLTAPYQLSSLSYANDLSRPPVVVVSSSPGPIKVNGALVSFNATTGKVASVLPYTAYRSSEAPVAILQEGVIVERGSFLGAWDADGKNRAPGGASEVHLDARTGAILRVK